ncbi:hypothetical protein HNP33_002629 [Comamonas odontotermitis]|uniref:Uncharacterized protein n=1 Tax=Comamonas odontotermitis TaxID=379895 RepID=A0ABR6RHA1_9BURK|nr:hypothetical protein [Comamonas odontotermitis]
MIFAIPTEVFIDLDLFKPVDKNVAFHRCSAFYSIFNMADARFLERA